MKIGCTQAVVATLIVAISKCQLTVAEFEYRYDSNGSETADRLS